MNNNKYGPFIVERARGGGYQIRNTETGSINTRSTIKDAREAAHKSMMTRQDRLRQESRSSGNKPLEQVS